MKPDFQRRIQRYGWDRAVSFYETGWQEQLWSAQERMLAVADPQPGAHVLDVSCGTGLVTIPLALLVGSTGHVTGLDISQGMIDRALERVETSSVFNTTFVRADAESLPFEDNTFDSVICALGLMYFPFPERALEEMRRVVKPGGQVTSLVWGERKNCGWAGVFPIVDCRVKSDVCPLFFRLGTSNTLQSVYEKAGLDQVKSSRMSVHLHYPDDEQACIAALQGGAVALAYQKFDEEVRREADAEYIESIQRYRNRTAYDIPGEFVIVQGRK